MAQISKLSVQSPTYQLAPAIITISNLRLRTYIGFNPEELSKQQDIIVNAEISYCADDASQSDDENKAVDYKVLTKTIIAHIEQGKFRLLEKLTSDLITIIMAEEQVLKATVTVDKPHALRFADSVSITLSAERND
ncbi:dihydroneopterin triphosphate 2'-epimerase [Flocculibacter collagenilyticus]|uniref:dihydroneopterin triphosphate 2'-epimerase n=1 Tax=Flocculibacter collagenilyticus TaxID=2744479 RepID=UPI0018F388A1|nr:dihydroneopterin triphosphate 2'-epimerase [Flocculibacter collagenilyticus]